MIHSTREFKFRGVTVLARSRVLKFPCAPVSGTRYTKVA